MLCGMFAKHQQVYLYLQFNLFILCFKNLENLIVEILAENRKNCSF